MSFPVNEGRGDNMVQWAGFCIVDMGNWPFWDDDAVGLKSKDTWGNLGGYRKCERRSRRQSEETLAVGSSVCVMIRVNLVSRAER
jgi:hypothetical protein